MSGASKRRAPGEGSIHQRKDGRWAGAIDITGPNGVRRRKAVYGRTRDDVAKKLRRVQQGLDAGLPVLDERRTVGSFLDWWITTAVPGTVSEGTLTTYDRLIRLYVKPALARTTLVKLAPRDITAMMNGMAERGLAPSTINQARKVLGRALRRGMQEDFVSRNVAMIVDGPKSHTIKRRSLTPEQARLLLRTLKKERLGAAFTVALALGLRRGEVLGLRWENVELGRGGSKIRVRQQLQRHTGKGLVLTDLKTPKSRRTLDLPPQVAAILRSHRAAQKKEQLRAGATWRGDEGLVFTTPSGTPVDPDNFRHLLSNITESAGLGVWKTHELRYSAGSLLFAMGVPMKVISETLGHSSERVTSDIYVQVMDEHRAEAASAMSKVLWGA